MHAAAGMPLVQDALLSVLESVHDQRLSLTQVVQKTAHNVAQRFDVVDRGFVRPGCFADLVLVDMQQATAATDANALYKCGWTPFNGVNFRSRILKTWVNGVNVYDEGTFTTDPCGQPLKFDR